MAEQRLPAQHETLVDAKGTPTRFFYAWFRRLQSLIDAGVLTESSADNLLVRIATLESEGSAADLLAVLYGTNGVKVYGNLENGVEIRGPDLSWIPRNAVPGPPGEDGADSWIPGPTGKEGPPGRQAIVLIPGEDGEDSWIPGPPGRPGQDGVSGSGGGLTIVQHLDEAPDPWPMPSATSLTGSVLGAAQVWNASHTFTGPIGTRHHIVNTGTPTSVDQTNGGLLLRSVTMNTTNKYTPALMFGSSDANFTTTNPKVLAGIVGYALEAYTADDDGYMGLEFFACPANPGVTPTPTSIGTATTDGWDIDLASTATAVTQSASDDSTKIATTAFVQDVAFATSAMQYVGFYSVSGGAVTTMPISGLDLNTDHHYLVRIDLKPALLATSSTISLFANSDTTAGNYDTQALQLSNSTFSNARVNAATIAAMAGTSAVGQVVLWVKISRSAQGYVTFYVEGSEDTGTGVKLRIAPFLWRTLATNLTGLTVSSSAAASLANDSRIDVWRIAR